MRFTKRLDPRRRAVSWLLGACLALAPACACALSPLQEQLRRTVEGLTVEPMLNGEGMTDVDLLVDFYTRRAFEPAWTPPRIDEMLQLIAASEEHGLRPADYHSTRLQTLVAERDAGGSADSTRIEIDILLTDALARLGLHLHFGKVDPVSLDPHWNFSRELGGIEPVLELQHAIDAPSIAEYGRDLLPQLPPYRRYRELLTRYRDIARNGGWPSVTSGPTLEPDANDPRVPELRRFLVAAGYLSRLAPDLGDLYEPAMQAAVADFQRSHALQVDARVGPATVAAMNVPVEARIDQIRVNMERVRWVFRDVEDRLLVVNIAGGNAFAVDHGTRVWRGRAIVGRPYRATPIFKAQMSYVVLNPSWIVPPTIFRNDVLPALRRDSAYLARHDMDVVDGTGTVLDASAIRWQSVRPGSFPYQLRQRPGPANPLGRIKFVFPNPYFVFLHDTPARELFARTERTFSSGCIRIEDPLGLAEWVLGDTQRWSAAGLDQAIATGETQTVLLAKPVTVMLLYWTVAFDDDWNPIFLKDVYQRDARVLESLDAPFAPGSLPMKPR